MAENPTVDFDQTLKRLHRSANTLRAYFEYRLKTALQLLTEKPAEDNEADVRFTSAINTYGLWGLRPSRPLLASDRREISQTFDTILGAMDELERQRSELARLQERLQQTLEETPSNVIPLRRSLQMRSFPVQPPRFHFRIDCLIQSPDEPEIRKLAIELHSYGSRLAFLDYFHLGAEERRNVQRLLEIGEVTLFVADILSLSREEQETLTNLLRRDLSQRPLLIIGSALPYSELCIHPQLNGEFVSLLSRAFIKLNKPFREYKHQGLVHYFLDSLSSQAT